MTQLLPRRPSAPRHTAPRSKAARAGFTLIEITIAIVILSVGLLAVASTSSALSKQMAGANRQTIAATIAQSRFDSLTSVSCTSLVRRGGTTSGSSGMRGVTETWSVVDGNDIVNIHVSVIFPGRTRPLAYSSVLPCRDSDQL